MLSTKQTSAILLVLGLSLAAARPLQAQGVDTGAAADIRSEPTDYQSSNYAQPTNYEPNARAIVQQNAQIRAQQRQLRISSMAWYGMSNSRPTASPTPFAARYSPVWESPGGRPYSWYSWNRPTYLIYR